MVKFIKFIIFEFNFFFMDISRIIQQLLLLAEQEKAEKSASDSEVQKEEVCQVIAYS